MKKPLPPLALLCLIPFLSLAQQSDTIEIQRNKDHQVIFARFKPNANRKMIEGTAFLSKVLSTKSGHEFSLTKETTDELGITHQRYAQYWKGIRIDNEEYLMHGKNGIVETINGESPEIDLTTVSPTLNERAAMEKALAYVKAKKYKWEDGNMERWIKENTQNENATYYPKGELVIAKGNLNGHDNYFLSWKFTISSLEPNNEQLIYVNAIDGNVISDISLICNINTTCTAQTRYSGQQNITGDTYAGGVRLFETRTTTTGHNANISTLNIQGGIILPMPLNSTIIRSTILLAIGQHSIKTNLHLMFIGELSM